MSLVAEAKAVSFHRLLHQMFAEALAFDMKLHRSSELRPREDDAVCTVIT